MKCRTKCQVVQVKLLAVSGHLCLSVLAADGVLQALVGLLLDLDPALAIGIALRNLRLELNLGILGIKRRSLIVICRLTSYEVINLQKPLQLLGFLVPEIEQAVPGMVRV